MTEETREQIREAANTIWNANAKLTHNELDDILVQLVESALQEQRE